MGLFQLVLLLQAPPDGYLSTNSYQMAFQMGSCQLKFENDTNEMDGTAGLVFVSSKRLQRGVEDGYLSVIILGQHLLC